MEIRGVTRDGRQVQRLGLAGVCDPHPLEAWHPDIPAVESRHRHVPHPIACTVVNK